MLPAEEAQTFDGLVTFFASLHAMRAEKVLKRADFACRLIPGPREISPHCGVALQFCYASASEVEHALRAGKVQIEAIHRYQLSELGKSLGSGNQ